MSTKELNEEYICNKIGGICQDCIYLNKIIPIIEEMLSKQYIRGLEQGKFDKIMNNITFEQFLNTYNFRYVTDKNHPYNEDTYNIRIYPFCEEDEHYLMWFELGIYDFSDEKMECLKRVLSKEILSLYVKSFGYKPETDSFDVFLTKEKRYE